MHQSLQTILPLGVGSVCGVDSSSWATLLGTLLGTGWFWVVLILDDGVWFGVPTHSLKSSKRAAHPNEFNLSVNSNTAVSSEDTSGVDFWSLVLASLVPTHKGISGCVMNFAKFERLFQKQIWVVTEQII